MRGFRISNGGYNINLLPFALDEDTYNDWMEESGPGLTDNWSWNSATKTISPGSDDWKEVNLYPQGTGSPGNRGTVDIGSSNNSTNDIARQILHGVNAADLAYHGGKIELDHCGNLDLNGDTGISRRQRRARCH